MQSGHFAVFPVMFQRLLFAADCFIHGFSQSGFHTSQTGLRFSDSESKTQGSQQDTHQLKDTVHFIAAEQVADCIDQRNTWDDHQDTAEGKQTDFLKAVCVQNAVNGRIDNMHSFPGVHFYSFRTMPTTAAMTM